MAEEADFLLQKAAFGNLKLESCPSKKLEEDFQLLQGRRKVSRVYNVI